MSNVAAFVAAAEKAEPQLVGSTDKDKAAVAKLVGETEAMSKDLSVRPLLKRSYTLLTARRSTTSCRR